MSIEEICDLPVKDLAADNCILFLWTTFPVLPDVFKVIEAWGFCPAKGTKILKADLTYVNAENLKVGDKLLAFDESPNETTDRRYYKFTKVKSTGIIKLPCYEITLKSGEKITCSENHQWLCRSISPNGVIKKWVETKNLMNNYNGRRKYPLGIIRLAPKSSFVDSYESGFLAGAIDGEGSLAMERPRIDFSQNVNAMQKTVKKYLEKFKISYSEYLYEKRGKIRHLNINGGIFGTLDFLMRFRPPRLLEKWMKYEFRKNSLWNLKKEEEVISIRKVGIQDCVALSTNSKTYIAEGFASHNTYSTIGFVWVKANKNKKGFFFGLGNWTRSNAEICLIATKGRIERKDASISQIVYEPIEEHSKKPDIVRDKIIQLVGELPRIELFARGKLPKGWSGWGNQFDNKI